MFTVLVYLFVKCDVLIYIIIFRIIKLLLIHGFDFCISNINSVVYVLLMR